MVNRKCGSCTACCAVIGVPALNKPEYQGCKHQKAAGCAIYGTPERPIECGQWNCAWLEGFGRTKDRPDKSGVLAYGAKRRGQMLIHVAEVWAGAIQQAQMDPFIDKVARQKLVVITTKDGKRRITGPPGELLKLKENLDEAQRKGEKLVL